MAINRYFKLWLPIIGLHTLHQIEESINFFQWYVDNAHKIPDWLLIVNLSNANRLILHPAYFIFATIAQIFFVSLMAFIFRHNEKVTKTLIVLYLFGLAFFIVWHIITSYIAHSYAPVMVTCFGGLYLIPVWIYRIFKLGKTTTQLK